MSELSRFLECALKKGYSFCSFTGADGNSIKIYRSFLNYLLEQRIVLFKFDFQLTLINLGILTSDRCCLVVLVRSDEGEVAEPKGELNKRDSDLGHPLNKATSVRRIDNHMGFIKQ